MLISQVTNEDGRRCAALMNALKAATYKELADRDIEALQAAKHWLAQLAGEMAKALSTASVANKAPEQSAPPANGFRVKSMGQMPTQKAASKKKK